MLGKRMLFFDPYYCISRKQGDIVESSLKPDEVNIISDRIHHIYLGQFCRKTITLSKNKFVRKIQIFIAKL